MSRLKRFLIGKPLKNEALYGEKYTVFWGLPILSSDAISSVAYATEEILWVLIPILGVASFMPMTVISGAIIALLAILTFSYRQTIENYPNGGGSYIVASDNLGKIPGVMAGASLAVDYIMTAAVSISAGVAAVISAFPYLLHYRVEICLLVLFLIFIGNLRGLRESSVLFGVPAYLFMLAMVSLIGWGMFRVLVLGYHPPELPHLVKPTPLTSLAFVFLMLRAFASGCTALTGVEAVSNAVPNFKEPSRKHAQIVLYLLSVVVFVIFGGISFLANFYHAVPGEGQPTVLAQIATGVFGAGNPMFFFVQVTTAIILAIAANTAYAGFPILFSVMARDGYAPRQLSTRGERLNYSNGVILLTLAAALLIIVFEGDTHLLMPLYAVGVFTSFTLSQSGMFIRWIRRKNEPARTRKAIINGSGAFVTLITVIIIGITKFPHGAWIVFVVVPLIMKVLLKIKLHYEAVAEQLRLSPEAIARIDINTDVYRNHVIVPVESVNKASVRALRYAKTISRAIVAFNVAINEEAEKKIREKWDLLNTDIPLVVKYSPYRKVVEPFLEYIESYEEHSYKKGDVITIILAQFSVRVWWHVFLHNQTRLFITRDLMKHKHIVIATMPLQLKSDKEFLDWRSRGERE